MTYCLISIILNKLMTSQCRRSQLILIIVHYRQRLTMHAHGLWKMACVSMKRKQKKCSFILEQKLTYSQYVAITANGKIIERVNNCKLLGVVINSELSWHAHVTYILQKVSKRIFCINNLARAGIYESDIIQVCLYLNYPLCSWICLPRVAPWFI